MQCSTAVWKSVLETPYDVALVADQIGKQIENDLRTIVNDIGCHCMVSDKDNGRYKISMEKIENSSPSMKKGVRKSLNTAVQIVKANTLYTTRAFETGTQARKKLEYAMSDAAQADRAAVKEALQGGTTLEEAMAEFVSEERFDAWYTQLMNELSEIVGQ